MLYRLGKTVQPIGIGQLLLHNVQPADPFVFVGCGPKRFIAGPKPPDEPLLAPDLHFRLQGGLHLRRARRDLQPGAFAIEQDAATLRDGAKQLVEGIRELLHAFRDQLFGDRLQRYAMPFQLGEQRTSTFDILLDDIGRHLAVVAEGIHGRRRDGVHGVATDKRLDIHRVLVGRIFCAGGSPEQALRFRACRGQTLPARAGEQSLIANVGKLRIGDRGLAAQPVRQLIVAELIEPFVDRAVDAADEDAGDAADLADVAAGSRQILKPGNIGFDDLLVDRDREKQGDVDVQPATDQLTDRRKAGRRRRYLHHQIGTRHRPPQP